MRPYALALPLALPLALGLLLALPRIARADSSDASWRSQTELQWRQEQPLHHGEAAGRWLALQQDLSLQHGPWRAQFEAQAQHDESGSRLQWAQAWVGQELGAWSWRLGRQRFDWAVLDTTSPADLINPRDWSDLSRPRKLTRPALSLRHDGASSLELVLAPPAEAARLPQGVWASPLPEGVRLAAGERSTRWSAALRWSAREGAQEFSLLGYHGESYAPMARLLPSVEGGATLQPSQDALDALCAGWVRPLMAGSLLRAEAAVLRHRHSQSLLQWGLSVDHEWLSPWRHDDSLYLLLQWQSEQEIGNTRPALPGWWDFRRVFARQWLMRLQYRPAEDSPWLLGLEGSLKPEGGRLDAEHFLRLTLRYQWPSGAALELGAQGLHGPRQSFWGGHERRDALSLTLNWRV